MKLEYDTARQQSDDIRFKSMQKRIYEEFKSWQGLVFYVYVYYMLRTFQNLHSLH